LASVPINGRGYVDLKLRAGPAQGLRIRSITDLVRTENLVFVGQNVQMHL